MNLVLGMVMLSAGGAALWSAFADPEGGVWAGLGAALTGQPITKRQGTTAAAFVSSVAGGLGTGSSAGGAAGGSSSAGGAPASGVRGKVVAEAQTWLGVPYLWAGNTRKGVDCSGLTKAVYRDAAGVDLPRVSAAQAVTGGKTSNPQPGDLVAFGAPVHHVGIYIGNGQMIHAPHTGTVVKVEKVWDEHTQYRDVLGGAK